MIFIDSNIPMYLVGAPHTHKTAAQRLLERFIAEDERLVSDAEALQEILHRYVAIHRCEAIQPAFDALLGVVDEVFPIDASDVEEAKKIVLGVNGLSARDAVHVAVMRRRGVARILTFDSGYDGVPGVTRLN
ncbi:MAG TPA: type II toxin-antitoxin system VapC family toxin [Anaeromyxobacteraceae bacterium]|nr:type II toxin-antitoxin system VapC family toxin [Anaeromyxobacteraceae bacterium]